MSLSPSIRLICLIGVIITIIRNCGRRIERVDRNHRSSLILVLDVVLVSASLSVSIRIVYVIEPITRILLLVVVAVPALVMDLALDGVQLLVLVPARVSSLVLLVAGAVLRILVVVMRAAVSVILACASQLERALVAASISARALVLAPTLKLGLTLGLGLALARTWRVAWSHRARCPRGLGPGRAAWLRRLRRRLRPGSGGFFF